MRQGLECTSWCSKAPRKGSPNLHHRVPTLGHNQSRHQQPAMMLVIRKARFPRYGLLGVLIRRPAARPLRAPTLPRGSSRHTSSSAERSPPPPPPGQESFGQVMRRAIRISNVFNAQTFRQAFRDSPEETSFAVFWYALLPTTLTPPTCASILIAGTV